MMHGFIREREFARESPADARGSAADPHGYGGEIHRRIRDIARKFIHSGYAFVRIERARDVEQLKVRRGAARRCASLLSAAAPPGDVTVLYSGGAADNSAYGENGGP